MILPQSLLNYSISPEHMYHLHIHIPTYPDFLRYIGIFRSSTRVDTRTMRHQYHMYMHIASLAAQCSCAKRVYCAARTLTVQGGSASSLQHAFLSLRLRYEELESITWFFYNELLSLFHGTIRFRCLITP
jgi:hypothetical protein